METLIDQWEGGGISLGGILYEKFYVFNAFLH